MKLTDIIARMKAKEDELAYSMAACEIQWAKYVEKLRSFEMSVKLVAFHASETATAAKGCAYFADEAAYYCREALNGIPKLAQVAEYIEFNELPVQTAAIEVEQQPSLDEELELVKKLLQRI